MNGHHHSHSPGPQDDYNHQQARRRQGSSFESLHNGGIKYSEPLFFPPSANDTPFSPSRTNYINTALDFHDKQYLPSQPKSLSGIAFRSFALGAVFTLFMTSTITILLFTTSPLWRVPFFLTLLSTFHFLEFFLTAHYNTRSASISSFLFSQNGKAYNIAHTSAMLECLARSVFFPNTTFLPAWLSQSILLLGLFLIVIGQTVRSFAMAEAGTNFNHIVQSTKSSSHQLVTSGIYGFLRHPSYFGFFWWGIGTQLMLGNPICGVGYVIVLWRFFDRRIQGEEGALKRFFGDEYGAYRERVGTGIPFIR